MISVKSLMISLALITSVLSAPITIRELGSDPNDCQRDLGNVVTDVQNACAGNADATACTSATAAAIPAITGSCGSVADAQSTQSAGFAMGVSQASGVSCTDATNNAFNALFEGCTGGSEFAPLIESPGCDAAKATVLGLVSTSCPTSASSTGDVTATLSAAGAQGSAAAAVASATAELNSDKAELKTTPSADNCQINLGLVVSEVQDACSVQSDDSSIEQSAKSACNAATGQALSSITPACGAVAEVKQSNSAGFATGVSQANGVSCTDATNNAFNALFQGCSGGSEFAPLVESPACDVAKATVIGLVSTACPASS